MILDSFSNRPEFPFDMYFESANHYAAAMEYWMAVLRAADGFEEAAWTPRDRPLDVENDMYLGKVIDIISMKLRKEINLQTWSIPGDANMLLKENSGLRPAEYAEQKASLGSDFELPDQTLNGMSHAEAIAEAQEEALQTESKIWVEKTIHWQADPQHKDGGYDVEFERLVITSQITLKGETATLQALAMFFLLDTAQAQINATFSFGSD